MDLLHTQPAGLLPDVKAIGFATPAIGNLALADHVKQQGWQFYLSNYLLPGELQTACHPSTPSLRDLQSVATAGCCSSSGYYLAVDLRSVMPNANDLL